MNKIVFCAGCKDELKRDTAYLIGPGGMYHMDKPYCMAKFENRLNVYVEQRPSTNFINHEQKTWPWEKEKGT